MSYQVAQRNFYLAKPIISPASFEKTTTFIGLLKRPHFYRGYINQYRQPSALIECQINQFNAMEMMILQRALNQFFSEFDVRFDEIHSEYELALCLGKTVSAFQKVAGLPIFQEPKVSVINTEENLFAIWVPSYQENYFHRILSMVLKFFMPTDSREFIFNEMKQYIQKLKNEVLVGANSLKLLMAAHHEEIPWRYVGQNTFQYGYGQSSRWFDSTFTDKTARISASMAKDKASTWVLLQRAGLPVPEQRIVKTEAEAIEAANQIGYPVVIKPHNQDRGIGVHANLISDAEVKNAFHDVAKYADMILLQKHISGKDYRLVVLNGELIWAIERIPANVIGDGIHTIEELIKQTNKIKVTNDVIQYLANQSYTLHSIPKANEFVSLNRIANISQGGTPVAVFDKVHPDNKRLIEAAANLFRLDIAGIDFITADIEQSHFKNGGAIIEINAQPQLGSITAAHIYHQLLLNLVPNRGRIPIILVYGEASDELFIEQLKILLFKKYKHVGLVKHKSAYLNANKLVQTDTNFQAALGLLFNPSIDAFIYFISSYDDIQNHGLPFDRYDYLCLLRTPNEKLILNTLLDACSKQHFIDTDKNKILSELEFLMQ